MPCSGARSSIRSKRCRSPRRYTGPMPANAPTPRRSTILQAILTRTRTTPGHGHTEHSGASMAVRRDVYRAVGGIVARPTGEDRAFAAALLRRDARVRHSCDARVVVSGRIVGRAVGGMADTIRRRLVSPDTMVDDALEPALARVRRLRLRAAARAAYHAADERGFAAVAAQAGLDAAHSVPLLGNTHFGDAWAALDALLPHDPVAVVDLEREMTAALSCLDRLIARLSALVTAA